MSEFELSTLAVLALLLFTVGAYSYWQVHRAQKAQEARQAELAELAVEPPSQHRYPAYVQEQGVSGIVAVAMDSAWKLQQSS